MTTTPVFAGFTPAAIQFLADLAANNDRAWFNARKADYEQLLKGPIEALLVALAERFEARGIPLAADPKRSPFRIYRDTRFSRDKSPYKTHLGASMPWVAATGATSPEAGEGSGAMHFGAHRSGAYFHFEPGEMFAGGGMWMPPKPRLDAFRAAVRDEPGRVRAALEDSGFVAWFGAAEPSESLKRIPAGYPADHELADLFRWKDVVFGRRLSDAQVCSADLPDHLADGYEAAVPVLRFLAGLA